jgi:hypothetical protein
MKLLPDFATRINLRFRGGGWTLNVTLASVSFTSKFTSVDCANFSGFQSYGGVR